VIGDFVRDKDGVIGSALIAALCSKTDPLERLNELYKQYGFHTERLLTIKKKSPQEAVSLYQKRENLHKALRNRTQIEDIHQSGFRQSKRFTSNDKQNCARTEPFVAKIGDQGNKYIFMVSSL